MFENVKRDVEELPAFEYTIANKQELPHRHLSALLPSQFQKQLQLQEARRLRPSEDLVASTAGYRVG